MGILLKPALLFRSVYRGILADDAPSPEVVGDFLNDIQEFQVVSKPGRDGGSAIETPGDVAADGASGIAVARMVYGRYDRFFK